MVDVWLIILTVVFSIISAGFSIFIIFYFRAKEEENTVSIWIGRAIVFLNIFIGVSLLATVPLDFSNSTSKFSNQINVNGLH